MPDKAQLFTVTHWLLKAATWLTLFSLIVLGIALGAVLGMSLGLIPVTIPPEELQKISLTPHQVMLIALGIIASLWVALALVMLAFYVTTRIVESAMAGNPFVVENARRLMQIGWLLLAVQAMGLIVNTVLDQLPKDVEENLSFGLDPSPIGLLAVLLIFVLAQIFRHGSDMRAELEATI